MTYARIVLPLLALSLSADAAHAAPDLADRLRTAKPAEIPATKSRTAGRAKRVASANRDALREPNRDAYIGAIQVYPWSEGTVYRLVASPERVSDIALEPGETLVSVAAGDTARWSVGDTTSGAAEAQRTHIMIKPQAVGLRTNLVIMTDRRVYHLMLESVAASAMVAVRWSYAGDSLVSIRRETTSVPASGAASRAPDPTSLNFDYVVRGDKPAWRPRRAFDDGRQTFIEFPASLDRGSAPPFFVVGEDGRSELINYRVAGHYYVIDRLFDVGELRIGEKKQTVVRVCKSGARNCSRWGKGK